MDQRQRKTNWRNASLVAHSFLGLNNHLMSQQPVPPSHSTLSFKQIEQEQLAEAEKQARQVEAATEKTAANSRAKESKAHRSWAPQRSHDFVSLSTIAQEQQKADAATLAREVAKKASTETVTAEQKTAIIHHAPDNSSWTTVAPRAFSSRARTHSTPHVKKAAKTIEATEPPPIVVVSGRFGVFGETVENDTAVAANSSSSHTSKKSRRR